jgi:hypothetical protein
MRQRTTLVMLAVAGCAVVATAACSSPSTPPVAAPTTLPSASAGVGGPDAEAPSPTASPTASPSATSKKPPTGQGGESSEVDWKRVAFRTLGCKHHAGLPDRAEVQRVDHADLTGDGQRDAIVTASCPTTTSTNAVHVFVFDGDSTGKPLLDAGKGEYLRTADVTVSGRKIKIDAEALSKQASLCCPDLRITQSWRWSGSAFEPEAKSTEKI